jgi:hypothetical protein
MRQRYAPLDLQIFGSNACDVFERRKAGMLKDVAVVLMLALTSCAPSSVQTQYAQYVTPPKPALMAPPEIANKPGYLELKVLVANQSGNQFRASSRPISLPIHPELNCRSRSFTKMLKGRCRSES